jgi:hypothetical protein
MNGGHRDVVRALLRDAATEHERLVSSLPPDLKGSLPVDAQGVTRAIDHLADAAGFSQSDRRALVRPHGINPAVVHARVFGGAPLTYDTVIGAFVEGARVRAEALATIGDTVGGEPLGREVRKLLSEHPPPANAEGAGVVEALRATYTAQERAAIVIAASLDAQE